MLEGGEVKDIIISGTVFDEGIKNVRAAVNGECGELSVDIAEGAADVPYQFNHVVFTDVNHMEQLRATLKDFAYHCGTDGTGSTDDQETGGRYKGGQFFFVGGYIGREKRNGATDERKDRRHWLVLIRK
jgi:hypothetical protein